MTDLETVQALVTTALTFGGAGLARWVTRPGGPMLRLVEALEALAAAAREHGADVRRIAGALDSARVVVVRDELPPLEPEPDTDEDRAPTAPESRYPAVHVEDAPRPRLRVPLTRRTV